MENPKILILFYSMYGHIYQMAQETAKGVEEAGGQAVLRQVADLVPDDKLNDQMKQVKQTMADVPMAQQDELESADGIIVATPTRFGNMAAQMRNFWDQTSKQWMAGTLIGKPAGVITSTATQHGGQETTIISTMITLLHHGCVLVGFPYSFTEQMTLEEISGGSPYGVSTIAGTKGERQPSENEKTMARKYGAHLTGFAKKLQ